MTPADQAPPKPRGTYIIVPHEGSASPAEKALAQGTHRILYVNGQGATVQPGNQDDSSTQTSSILSGTAQIPAYGGSSAQWQQFLTCIQDEFARWDVTVTDQDPGATPHVEALVGGGPESAGFPSGVGGVSPMTNDCSIIETSIVYVFSAAFGEDPTSTCEVTAQEVGHSYGLDHEYLCADPMTYLEGCGHKTFQDQDASCGESGPRTCACGGSTQNSVQLLTQRLGAATGNPPPPPPPPPPNGGGDTTAPSITLVSPSDGAVLPGNSTLTIDAQITDPDDAVAHAVLVWDYNGQELQVDCDQPPQGLSCAHNGGSYEWSLSVGTGARSWSIQATDSNGNSSTSATRSLTLDDGSGGSTGGSSGGSPQPPPSTGPTASIDAPAAGAVFSPGDDVPVQVAVDDPAATVTSAQLVWHAPSGDVLFDLDQLSATEWGITLQLSAQAVSGSRTLTVNVADDAGQTATSAPVSVQVQ